MTFRAVVFDHYFTLADPEAETAATFEAMLARVAPHLSVGDVLAARRRVPRAASPRPFAGEPPPFRSFRDDWVAYGQKVLAVLGVSGGGTAFADARFAAHASAPLYPDVRPTFAALRTQGLRLGALCDGDRGYVAANIERHALRFDAVVCSDDIRCYKPHHRGFDAVCRALGVTAADAVMVGDTPETDMAGARHAGLRSVWINRRGIAWPPALEPPDHEVASLEELAALAWGVPSR